MDAADRRGGEPAYLAELRALAQRLGLAERCQWLGFVAGARKLELLQRADWFVLPSASENFGIAAAEALAAGTPVILCPGVAIAAAVERAGAGVVVEADLEALAGALKRALEQPPAAMTEAARLLATNIYCWGSIVAQLEQYYQEILKDFSGAGGRRPSARSPLRTEI
ncbi:glycosyltransferase [Cyanobium sp. ATX-6F1]|uniref:glycosyltransferase n=1 Tax=Cyanobium sp. ATX-6F1 TaxID=3137388 RepID=UPI0039BE4505